MDNQILSPACMASDSWLMYVGCQLADVCGLGETSQSFQCGIYLQLLPSISRIHSGDQGEDKDNSDKIAKTIGNQYPK